MRINPNTAANAGTAEPTAAVPAASAAPENTGLIIAGLQPDKVIAIMQSARLTLQLNKNSVKRAITVGRDLLEKIKASGMTAELDAECNTYLVRVKKTLSDINERRSPLTQLLSALAKEFTTLEASIDVAKAETPAAQIQVKRNEFVKAEAERKRQIEAEANRKLQADKEVIQLKADAEAQLTKHFNDHLSDRLSVLQQTYNGLTLENYETRLQELHEFPTAYSFAHFDNFLPRLMPIYVKQEELQNIVTNSKLGKYDVFAKEFADKVVTKRMELIDRMPSQHAELTYQRQQQEAERIRIEELRKKDADAAEAREKEAAAERERQAAIQREREAEAERKLEQEKKERELKAAAEIEMNRTAEMAGALFEAQVAVSEAAPSAAKVKEGYEIVITNQLAYSQLLMFYLEKQGKTEDIEKLGKKTLNSLKKFAEEWAFKNNDEKISSIYLRYEETYKAVTKASK